MIVEIQNKKVGFKFNNHAIEQLQTIKGREKSMYAFLGTICWCAYLGWCLAKQVDEELDFEQISDWVDSSINNTEVADQVNKIFELYQQCEAYKRLQKKSELNGKLELQPDAEEK